MLSLRVLAICLAAALPMSAQRPQNPRSVSFGHIHLNSANPDAAVEFWTETIGASTFSRGSLSGLTTIGSLILITKGEPSGPGVGSVVDHIAFRVPDLQPFIGKLAKSPWKSFQPVAGGDRLLIDGPDGVRIELIEESTVYIPLEMDHVHLHFPDAAAAREWYGRMFGARKGPDDKENVLRLPGATLIFDQAEAALPTAGRSIDHLAFEIKDLEGFCRQLAAEGIRFDSPYKASPELRMSSAFLTDPWGTRIELTEGLAR